MNTKKVLIGLATLIGAFILWQNATWNWEVDPESALESIVTAIESDCSRSPGSLEIVSWSADPMPVEGGFYYEVSVTDGSSVYTDIFYQGFPVVTSNPLILFGVPIGQQHSILPIITEEIYQHLSYPLPPTFVDFCQLAVG
jgi:hypothetical protein